MHKLHSLVTVSPFRLICTQSCSYFLKPQKEVPIRDDPFNFCGGGSGGSVWSKRGLKDVSPSHEGGMGVPHEKFEILGGKWCILLYSGPFI